MAERKPTMKKFEDYIVFGTKEEALDAIHEDVTRDVENVLNNMYEGDLYRMVQSYFDEDLHEMSELDDVFDYMKATEILENLNNIDTEDAYFNADTCRSSQDMWDSCHLSYEEVLEQIVDGTTEVENYDIDRILDKEEQLTDMVNEYFDEKIKKLERAKALFDMAMKQNPDEVISLLWNMDA